jgi:hypothetical protein
MTGLSPARNRCTAERPAIIEDRIPAALPPQSSSSINDRERALFGDTEPLEHILDLADCGFEHFYFFLAISFGHHSFSGLEPWNLGSLSALVKFAGDSCKAAVTKRIVG